MSKKDITACNIPSVADLETVDSLFLSDTDSCAEGNGGCEQLCVVDSSGYYCECRAGYRIGADGKSCYPDQGEGPIAIHQQYRILQLKSFVVHKVQIKALSVG